MKAISGGTVLYTMTNGFREEPTNKVLAYKHTLGAKVATGCKGGRFRLGLWDRKHANSGSTDRPRLEQIQNQ